MITARILVASSLGGLMLAACGPEPEPTLSAGDLANTAVAAAWTNLAETQTALPTVTPLPPTITPMPTSTVPPTVAPLTTAPGPATATADTCDQPPPSEPVGATTSVTLINKSGGQANLALGMNKPNGQGECGTYSYNLGVFGSETVKVLAGCYWGYGWVTGADPSTAETIELLCVTDPGTPYEIVIGSEVIEFK